MRSNIAHRDVSTHGVGQIADFRIKATGKAFQILIDGLYSDKIRAVIREISSNAYDAHAMAGTPEKPFDVQLPNTFDPIFRVRDYGVGMDHDTIMHLYTTVFESSKEDTNEQVGKFGLGSKSPFAYTDTFTVTAFDGTERRSYSAFIGPGYVPQIAFMGVESSDEPRGIEVQFPVRSSDCYAFQQAAKATYIGFDVPPKVTGANLELEKIVTVISGTGWKLVRGGPYSLRAHAKQGCVVYPIDVHALDHISEFERSLLSSPLFIDFPIGDLDITPSRESLGYDADTKANIRKRVGQIADEIVAIYQTEIDAQPTMWKACVKFNQITKNGLDRTVADVLKARIKYKGKDLRRNVDLGALLRPAFDKTFDNGGLRAMKVTASELNKGRHYGKRTALKFESSTYIQVAAGETLVVFDDADHPASLAQSRLRHWWDNLPDDERAENVLWVKSKADAMVLKRLLVTLGRPDKMLKLADMERPPVDKNAPGARRPTKVKVLERNAWVEVEIDENASIIYVELLRTHTLGHNGKYSSSYDVDQARHYLVALGYITDDTKIYGIPQTHKRKIAANDHWQSFWTLCATVVSEQYDETKASVAASYARKVQSYQNFNEFFMGLVKLNTFTGFADTSGPAAVLYKQWEAAISKAKATDTMNTALNLHTLLGGTAPAVVDISFEKEEVDFMAAYPLAETVIDNEGRNHTFRDHLIDYVNAVDRLRAIDQSDVNESDALAA